MAFPAQLPLLRELAPDIIGLTGFFSPALVRVFAWIEIAPMTSSVVFIDSRVADPDRLIASLAPGTACYRLDAASDGLAQIAAVLSQHTGLDSVHIVSHGAPGSLLLGAGTLDAAGLAARAATLARIGQSFGPKDDLLLYGCSVADGAAGQSFIDLLALLTGTDVAASIDPTGAGERGGDEDLESQHGIIETTPLATGTLDSVLASGNASGAITITGTATENTSLGVNVSTPIADPDGIGAITYQWQISANGTSGWSNASTGSTLALDDPLVGKYIRVLAKFTDQTGYAESITSTNTLGPVADVNDAPGGSVAISTTGSGVTTPTQNYVLTASNNLTDADGLGAISYQWQSYDGSYWSPIVGNTASTFTPTQTEVGKTLRVAASYTDGHGNSTIVYSPATAAVANQDDPYTGTVDITVSGGAVSLASPAPQLSASLSAGFDDPDGLGIVTYTWEYSTNGTSGWIPISTGSTLGLSAAHVGRYIHVIATYTDGGGKLETVTSTATTAVTGVNHAYSGGVTLSGTPTQGQILSATNNLTDSDGLGAITYQWQSYSGSSWNNISTGNNLTLTQAQVGLQVRVVASYLDGGGTTESAISIPTTAIVDINDNPTGSPVISGTITQGQTLTASLGTLADPDGIGTLTYKWESSSNGTSGWTPIIISGVNATGPTLVLGQNQVNQYIRVVADYIDTGTLTTNQIVPSSATPTKVANINDAPGGAVTITGSTTATEGQTLQADVSTLTDTDGLGTISYTWESSSNGTSGWSTVGTTNSLTLAQAHVNKYIRVTARYTDGFGYNEVVTSSNSSLVGNVNNPHTGTVTISGTAMVNNTLTASNALADVDGLGSITYTWQSSANGTSGWTSVGTGSSLTIGSSLLNQFIRVAASFTDLNGGVPGTGATETEYAYSSNVVLPPNKSPTGSVTITGTVAQGQTLKATNTLADADGLGVIAYQWQTSSDNTTWSNLSTGSSLALTETHVNKYIRVVASYTDGLTNSESVTSSASTAVANVNDVLTGSVTISGTGSLNQILTASNTFADADGLGIITYQWQSFDGTKWNDISTGQTLGLSEAQVGKKIRVIASYTDGHGTLETATSNETIAVTNANNSPSGNVTVTGTTTQGQTLTAGNTLADTDGLGTITYQWQSSANGGTTWSNISTGNTLVLTEAQVGKTVRVLTNYVDGMFTSESIPSTATAVIANINDVPTGSVAISGTAALNKTLTASHSLVDADGLGTISYIWQSSSDKGASWSMVSAGDTLSLTEALVGKQIRVTANYTDGHGTSESVASSATTEVRGSGSSTGGGDDGGYGSGNDKITGESGDNVIDAGGGNNSVTTGAGNDQITAGSGNDRINAGDGDNIVNAGNGKNSIVTGAGNDQIVTGSGSDKIGAGAGSDTVNPGAGKDKITLGLGADVLILDNRASGGADTVNYFNATEDQFQFDVNVFTALAGGVGAGNLVIGTRPVARDADDFLLFDTQKGRLYYDADGDGSSRAILIVAVKFAIGTPDSDNFAVF